MKIKLTHITMNYEIYGKGKPLILVHGNQEDHHIFDCLIDALKDSYHIYALDNRNHGDSSKNDDYSYDAMTDDLYEFILKLDIQHPSILGFSDGGIIALKLAIKVQNLLNKLILCGVNYDVKGITKKAYKDILNEYNKTKNPLLKLMIDQPHILKNSIKNIELNTLIIVGQYDVIKLKHTHKLHHMIKNSKLMILDHKAHDDYIIDKDDLKNIIKEFV
ncbi:alpha/beta fold hydrolase [Mariniplasma anaerobium]|uniref:Alpha/beta hydrolase n=1 Tax=Mariniplasma anaerobium TaxID=2735436 RepID=A0A7U9XVC8_9MOLU|nr:alpha/beta hydrolase [Mariniplasma anaerobium]BCR35995.1 alpha/beta hydrolase [Mariniplasma anaerobium]